MGVTIHYRGKLANPQSAGAFIAEIEDICRIMKWKYRVLNDDWNAPIEIHLIRKGENLEIAGNAGLKGISFNPHKECEWVNLYFDKEGNLDSPVMKALRAENGAPHPDHDFLWVKTQFAPVTTHITIVKLLKHLERNYFAILEVHDEGGYWDSADMLELLLRMDRVTQALDIIEEELSAENRNLFQGMSPEGYADYIEKVFKKRNCDY